MANDDTRRYLFAVDPEQSTLVAKWCLPAIVSEPDVARIEAACQARVGDAFVVLRSEDHPDWAVELSRVDSEDLPPEAKAKKSK